MDFEKKQPNSKKDLSSTLEKERKYTEKKEEKDERVQNVFNKSDINLKSDLNLNQNNMKISQINNMNMDTISINAGIVDDYILDKPYSDFHNQLNEMKLIDEIERKDNERQNLSLIENLKSKNNMKKPPIPALNNLYKNADKNFLNRIQNILKNKPSKKLNYQSSDEEQ